MNKRVHGELLKCERSCLCPSEERFGAGFIRRRADLQGVGRGVTEPDIKQKLGQVRGARRGRRESACGIEPCVGTNLTPSPSSPVLSAHPRAALHPHSPSLLYFLFHCIPQPSAHTASSTPRRSTRACLFCSEVTDKNFSAVLPPTGGVSIPRPGRLGALRAAPNKHGPTYTEGGELISPIPPFQSTPGQT